MYREIIHWQMCKSSAARIVAVNAVMTGRGLGSSEGEPAPGYKLGIPQLYTARPNQENGAVDIIQVSDYQLCVVW